MGAQMVVRFGMLMVVIGVMAMATSSCRSKANEEKQKASVFPTKRVQLAKRGEVRAVLELETGAVLAAGHVENVGAIFRIDSEGQSRRVFTGEKGVISIAARGTRVWAGVSNGYKEQFFTESNDSGENWSNLVPVPLDEFAAMQVTENSVWAYDITSLIRSSDNGTSWQHVAPAIPISLDSRFLGHRNAFCQYGDGYWCMAEDGTWEQPYGKVVIVAIDHSNQFAIEKMGASRFRVVALKNHLTPIGIPFDANHVRHLHVTGPNVVILASPKASSLAQVARGWTYITSTNRGQTWQQQRLPARIGVGFDDHLAYMGQTRELLALHGGFTVGLVERSMSSE